MLKILRWTAACLLIALLLPGALGEDIYYGSWPEEDVYLTQTVKHTCTLIACTMMLRNCACQRIGAFDDVTEPAVRRVGWSKQYGLSHSFVVDGMEVACSDDIRRAADKKQYLIECLKRHPEGVVIYDTGAPHAIWLFGYDEGGDIFWCADTIKSRGGHEMPLIATSIRGKTQQDKVNTIDKIWYVADREFVS